MTKTTTEPVNPGVPEADFQAALQRQRDADAGRPHESGAPTVLEGLSMPDGTLHPSNGGPPVGGNQAPSTSGAADPAIKQVVTEHADGSTSTTNYRDGENANPPTLSPAEQEAAEKAAKPPSAHTVEVRDLVGQEDKPAV